MNPYKYIRNPLNGKSYLLLSNQGQKILQKYLIQKGGAASSTSKKRPLNRFNIKCRKPISNKKSIITNLSHNVEVITFTVPGKILYWNEAEFFWQFIYNFSETLEFKNLQNLHINIDAKLQIISHQNTSPEYKLTFKPSRILGLFDTITERFSTIFQEKIVYRMIVHLDKCNKKYVTDET